MSDDLRRSVVQELQGHIDKAPDLAPHEFTQADFVAMLGLRRNKGRQELARLLEEGIIAGGNPKTDGRYDPRSKRRVVAYWRVEDSPDGGSGVLPES